MPAGGDLGVGQVAGEGDGGGVDADRRPECEPNGEGGDAESGACRDAERGGRPDAVEGQVRGGAEGRRHHGGGEEQHRLYGDHSDSFFGMAQAVAAVESDGDEELPLHRFAQRGIGIPVR